MRMGFAAALRAVVWIACIPLLAACGTVASDTHMAGAPANRIHSQDILYVTDRAPVTTPDGKLSYGSGRDRSVSFGSALVHLDPTPGVDSVREDGRFPPTPFAMQRVAAGIRREPEVVASYERASRNLQDEVARRLANSPRKEVVIFVHGYANTFDDAVESTGEICDSLGHDFVCIALTWPAAGKGGAFMGYNVDRESGEFAVADMKRILRTISQTKGLDRIHVIAHSRGTDIMASVMQQLGIEAYAGRASISQQFKIHNLVLFAPDIDMDVARSKFFAVGSDPDLPFGGKANPDAVLPENNFHLTIYSSPNDRALGLSTRLFGSVGRLGQLSILNKAVGPGKFGPQAVQFAGLADFVEFSGKAGFIGHSYFLSNPTVNADLVALLRDRLPAGDPGRPIVEIKAPFWRIAEPGMATASAR